MRQEPKKTGVTPIFIFSLPRSGSTLLQKILGGHALVSTISEPWFLLPLFYAVKSSGIYTEYDHRFVRQAVRDLYESLPNKQQDFTREIRRFALNIYSKASKDGACFFIDKTPRYHLIIDEIADAFPDAKFIFLWRNPLAVASSINKTWAKGKWKLYAYKVDLYTGLDNLVLAKKKYINRSISIRYEDLVTKPEDSIKSVCKYIDIDYDESLISHFTDTKLSGCLGDPTGSKKYQEVSGGSLNSWALDFSNPVRKKWATGYLRWIGSERMSVMGYDYDKTLSDLRIRRFGFTQIFSDMVRMVFGFLYCMLEPVIIVDKIKLIKDKWKIHAHR